MSYFLSLSLILFVCATCVNNACAAEAKEASDTTNQEKTLQQSNEMIMKVFEEMINALKVPELTECKDFGFYMGNIEVSETDIKGFRTLMNNNPDFIKSYRSLAGKGINAEQLCAKVVEQVPLFLNNILESELPALSLDELLSQSLNVVHVIIKLVHSIEDRWLFVTRIMNFENNGRVRSSNVDTTCSTKALQTLLFIAPLIGNLLPYGSSLQQFQREITEHSSKVIGANCEFYSLFASSISDMNAIVAQLIVDVYNDRDEICNLAENDQWKKFIQIALEPFQST